MPDFTSLPDQLHEAALILVAHDAVDKPERAVWALRNSGFTTKFVGVFLDDIRERAREIGAPRNYSPNVVFLNSHRVH
jgi:hypothetical protein